MGERIIKIENYHMKYDSSKPTEIELSKEGIDELSKIKDDIKEQFKTNYEDYPIYVKGTKPIIADGLNLTRQDLSKLTNEVLPEQIFFE